MKKYSLFLLIPLLISSCVVVKKTTSYSDTPRVNVAGGTVEESDGSDRTEPEVPENEEAPKSKKADDTAESVIETAMGFTGVRYKYGGLTRKGMDCSGLLYVSFQEHDIPLPRTSDQMAEKGKKVRVSNVQKGDLLFFKTQRRGKKINHVGLVVEVDGDDVKFIHSTTSRGVIVSSLREGYWNYSFVKATRIF